MTRTILVTGAAGALGGAVVAHLVAEGCRVLAMDHAAQADLPEGVSFRGGVDLTDPAEVTAAMEAFDLSELHGLANIAGGFVWQTLAETRPETWERMFRINLLTTLNACQACLPALRAGRGAIVNVGAGAAARAGAGMGAYTASKSGVARLTESLAEEEKATGVRVNAVLPSIIDTPQNRADMPDADFGAWVTTDELAKAIGFLLSPAASGITGASLPVAGRV